jgi:predicted enzyme related to lactoylglutathione lyase
MAKKRTPARSAKRSKAKKAPPKAKKASPRKAKRAKKSAPSTARKSRGQRRTKPQRGKSGPLGIGTLHVDFLTYKSTQVEKFYREFLELKTEFSDMDGIDYLRVKTSSTSSIGFMPPHPDMRGEQPAPREPALYFMVEDVDRAYQYLLGKGAAFVRPPETMPWGHRVLVTTDPEGRTVMIAGKAEPED